MRHNPGVEFQATGAISPTCATAASRFTLTTEEWIAQSFADILKTVPDRDEAGTDETPERFARAWAELTSGYAVDIEDLFKTFDADGYDEMISCSPIQFVSLCEHHALAFAGQAHVVYIPDGRIIGLSKIPRLVDAFARRLQVQERLTTQIADALEKYLAPLGVLVMVEAEHSCATLRGARSHGLRMRTQVVRGALMEKPAARAEALALIGRSPSA